jgi:glycoprotein 6-alpha-L-fucosyltransferase
VLYSVHIRRTDKVGTEAEFHAVEEYMTHVEEWFDAYEHRNPGITRKIYLASDDPGVLQETKLK